MNRAFWAGKRVFLTGHTGFKGAWLSLWLQDAGAHVHGYALAPESPSLFEAARVGEGMSQHLADIGDAAMLSQALREFAPDIIVHMAAQSLVRRSYEDPVATYATNVIGTANLLQAARQLESVRAVVVVTSDKCYENTEAGHAFTETDPLGGRDPYSSSKACTELVTASFGRSFYEKGSCGLASARAGNAIGGGDWAEDRILPDLFRALLSGGTARIRNPGAVRPWQHVLEPLAGYLMVAERLYMGQSRRWEAWNFGPDPESEQTVETIVQKCCAKWGAPGAYERDPQAGQPEEAGILHLDSSKARQTLGWAPRWSLEETLSRCTEWYRRMAAKDDMRAVTLQQIAAFEDSGAR